MNGFWARKARRIYQVLENNPSKNYEKIVTDWHNASWKACVEYCNQSSQKSDDGMLYANPRNGKINH